MKRKIVKMEVQHTSNLSTYLEVKKSKVKVTRLINAHTVTQYLPNGKAYELQTVYANTARSPRNTKHAPL